MNLANTHSGQADRSIAEKTAKPLRIAVLLGDTANLAPHSALKLDQLERVQICALDAALPPPEPTSLTALLEQAITAIEQGKLVELMFNDSVQPQSLFLLD
ncbi:MAG: PfaB family protein, partial [Shewanella sp.]